MPEQQWKRVEGVECRIRQGDWQCALVLVATPCPALPSFTTSPASTTPKSPRNTAPASFDNGSVILHSVSLGLHILNCTSSGLAIMTMSATPSPFNPAAVRPHVPSPLASNGLSRPAPTRSMSYAPSFPTSRPLRPFPSVANTLSGAVRPSHGAPSKKPVKIIEPPANFKGAFVLNLTQAELSRQD
ncbi:hypothetical protein B0H21DRAFT_315764 [Amylocystis lapponica]|nr:hypothetical protein B0H21DRAFT_315764 [Amylocystis lapponica]